MLNRIILRNEFNCGLIKFSIFRNIIILSLLYSVPCLEFSYPAFGQKLNCKLGDITWRCYDINLMKDIQDHGIKYESDRSIIWVEKDYLSSLDIRILQNRIDRAIINIEGILGIPFNAEYYRSKKVTIYVHSKKNSFVYNWRNDSQKILASDSYFILCQDKSLTLYSRACSYRCLEFLYTLVKRRSGGVLKRSP